MSRSLRVVLATAAVCSAWVPLGAGQEPPAKPNVRVEFRWVESKRIEGLTEDKGERFSCGPELSYPHKKPVLVLTREHVAKVELGHHDFSKSGLSSELYTVTLHLTKEARDTLAAECRVGEMKMLTVVVDGKYWGLRRYEKARDKFLVPEQARAESFLPEVGFFSSRAQAERLVDAFK
jgi:hypothetical protein